MRTEKVQPGYRVTPEVYELVKQYAAELTDQMGFPVSANNALEILIKRGYSEIQSEPQRG